MTGFCKHSHNTAGHRGGKILHHLSNSTLLKKYPAYFISLVRISDNQSVRYWVG